MIAKKSINIITSPNVIIYYPKGCVILSASLPKIKTGSQKQRLINKDHSAIVPYT